MPDENRIIDLKGFFDDDNTYNSYRGAEIIFKVQLLMSFPNDPPVRERLFTQFSTWKDALDGMKSNSELSKLKRQGQRNRHKASFAGTILNDVFKDHERSPEKCSGINNAIQRLAKYDELHPRYQITIIGGEKVKRRLPSKQKLRERTLKTYWKKYRSVAHLFAALGHHLTNPNHKKIVPKRHFNLGHFKPANFPGFLALAKMYQDFAVNYTPARARESLIPKDEIWRIEPDFELPALNIRHPQEIPRWVSKASRK